VDVSLVNWLRLGALGLIWGSSFMVVTIAIREFGPLTVAAGRIAIAALILMALLKFLRIPVPKLNTKEGRIIWFGALLLGAFAMALPFFLLSWGQKYVSSGFAGVSMAAGPILTLVLAHFFVAGEQLTFRKGLGFITGFAGVIILIGFDAFKSSGLGLEPLARLACIGAVSCYAIGSIITRLVPPVNPLCFAAIATMLAAIAIVPVSLLMEGFPVVTPSLPLAAIIFLGVVPTALANLLLVKVIRSAGPSFISLVNYQVPVWSVIFGTLFLNEVLPTRLFIALALILLGLAISQRRKSVKQPL